MNSGLNVSGWIGIADVAGAAYVEQHRAGRIGAAGLVAMRVGAIDQRLIGEIELRRPVGGGAARQLVPLLVDDAGDGIAVAVGQAVRSEYR